MLVCELFGRPDILMTSGLLLTGLPDGVQFQSPPTIIGKLETFENTLLRSLKKFSQFLLGP